MSALVWVMMGIAIWHFTVFLPDRYLWGIIGAFVGATLGAPIGGLIIHAGSIPGRNDTEIISAAEGIPGALLGIALMYWLGVRQEEPDDDDDGDPVPVAPALRKPQPSSP